MATITATLELADYRRRVSELYAAVRTEADPARAHALWRASRDELFRTHPRSPLPAGDPLRDTGVPYWDYQPEYRFTLPVLPSEPLDLDVPTDNDGTTSMTRVGHVEVFGSTLDVWWLRQYGGGLFVPVRDGSAGRGSYGGGRYALDTAKGADLGGPPGHVVLDFNFLYHPSCRYDSAWQCPLAPPGNTISQPIEAGERM
ncbi:MAG TPA: DUF1684 domain-containing protein [Pseudonocardiaceae bacterium]|jgi:hypothetical protein|nr:DUF1684 domain-containing protein [Pseudonocardiaceae bacterium]